MRVFPQTPSLAFLGERDYLQGGTLFDAIVDALANSAGPAQDIDFLFQRRTANLVTIVDDEPSPGDLVVATFSHATGRLSAIEAATPIVDRVAFDEPSLTRELLISDRKVEVLRTSLVHSFSAWAIAAFKALLKKEEPTFRAVFVRMKLDHVPAGDFSITYTRMIGGRFFEGRIEAEGTGVGFIYFGIWS